MIAQWRTRNIRIQINTYQLVDGLELDGNLNGAPEVVEAAPAQRPSLPIREAGIWEPAAE